MAKKRIVERRDPVYISDLFDGRSLDDVVLELHSLARKYEPEILVHDKDIKFETQYYGYDGGIELYVCVRRWETDQEYAKRMDREAAARERARKVKETKKAKALAKALTTEQEERELLAKLQEKYGA